ncbi:M43 family zinc metalloprotease [Xanthomarina gelatinilytica]|uniref:M43 family zinc metalloprotease n=1 Tax=Xanthomarina gelatinilytica TaxID=1137281 RepID=UPI003AA88672
MKKTTLNLLVLTLFCMPLFLFAQNKQKALKKHFNQELTNANQRSFQETGFIRCETVEYEAYLQNKFPKRATTEKFENWIAPKTQLIKQQIQSGTFRGGVNVIPVIFHVITDGSGGDNLSAAAIQAQLDQLNIDYANLAGSSYGSAADSQIQFCLAQVDENGVQLNEPGINRVTAYGGGPFSTTTIQSNIKAATQWDPEQYMNIWTANISGGILGYAQFPDPSGTGLDGLDPGDVGPVGAANTDGVVVAANSVGSVANPNPLGAPYNMGRTLTHEVGHWLGLRHIWGDTSACTNDDYCADTPDASTENYGCPTIDHCPSDGLGNDMVENYMDYTDDSCMDTFTADQVTRILAVMTNSPRRANLLSSTACQPAVIYDLDGRVKINNLNLDECDLSITPQIEIVNNGNNPISSITYSYDIDGNSPTSVNWSGSLANFGDSVIIDLPTLPSGSGAHTFNVSISNPNGSTDMNTANDTNTEAYSFGNSFMGSTSIELELTTDNWGDETTWEFANSSGTVLYSGGPLSDNTTYNESFAIQDNECYTFTIYDEYSDGICCDYGTGSYTLTDNLGTVIFTGGEFGALETTTITTASLSTSEFELSSTISIYPNPTTNVLYIKNTNSNVPDSYAVYNMLGQVVLSKHIANEADLSINTSSLSNGMYFIKIAKESSQVSLPFIKK